MWLTSGYHDATNEYLQAGHGLPPFANEPSTDFADPAARTAFGASLELVHSRLGQLYPLRIAGQSVVHSEVFESVNPSHPDQVRLKRIQLEMGGKNGVVVDETADLDQAADGIVTSAFSFQGQKCSAGSRAIVVDAVFDQVLERVVERAKTLRLGDPVDATVQVGPVIDGAAERNIREYIKVGQTDGRLVLGGGKLVQDGFFIEPTILADVDPKSTVAQEEIFGPVLAFIRARDFDDALGIANDTEFGLTGSLYSREAARLERARTEFHVGNLYFNRKSTGAMMGVHPFGGL